jgi:spermidine synthase / saccharopine dehydrogenase (NADP+, L-glutamate-forming)
VTSSDRTLSSLVSRVKTICKFPNEAESTRIISGLRWIGLFSSQKVKPRGGNLLDTLCAQLETLMKYEEGERDMIMLQHKFVVEWKDGKQVRVHVSICQEKAPLIRQNRTR